MAREANSGEKLQCDYQVFLSFRGCNTRQGFTDCLYHFLTDAGVRVYRDNEELPPGKKIEEVLTAINKSIVCIPILSRNYANSKWCLFELAKMVELKKDIMPIFYKVEADNVKLKTNLYSDQLSKFREQYNAEKAEWETALKEVAGIFDTSQLEGTFKEVGRIKAWTIMDYPGYGKLCKEVVREVLSMLEVKHKIFEGPLVGIDNQVEAMRKLLDVKSPEVRFIVIHGVGGVGKTTLAKVVFNQLCDSHGGFQRCCFLDNVRETTNHQDIVYLQNKLLRELGIRINEIHNRDSGINTIKDVVKNKKVLIILDDLDQCKQMESLAGDYSWFGSGSRIIITTRDPTCFVKHPKIWYHNMSGMIPQCALQLFCRHAFKKDSPPTDYLGISKEIAAACGRLPLALEVMGSYLHHIDKAYWKYKIKNIVSHKDVHDKLMMSYKTLDPWTREIFQDIACFFVGKKTTSPIFMWEACDFCPDEAIKHLLSLSLIKISKHNTFWMHDLLRDLGRGIVIQENLKRPEKHSRLWSQKEVKRILSREKGTSKTDALRLSCGSWDSVVFSTPLSANKIRPLQNLRFLELSGVELEGDFTNALQDLKWLSWNMVADSNVTNLILQDLVILELSCLLFPITNDMLSQIKIGENLKVLKLSDGQLSDSLFARRRSAIDRTEGLTKLTEILENSKSLVELEISCVRFREMPHSIGNLKNLRVMKLNYPYISELPSSIGNLEKLEELHVVHSRLKHIPEDIGRLHQLRILDLSCSEISQLPSTVDKLSHLQHLVLEHCDEIQELPKLPSSLTLLHVSSQSLWRPPNLSNLERLNNLLMHGNMDASNLPNHQFSPADWINNCPSLESYSFAFRSIAYLQMETSAFPRLKQLQLCCPSLQIIGQLPLGLTSLHLTSIDTSIRLPRKLHWDFKLLKSVSTCIRLPTCLGEMEALNRLVISRCKLVDELNPPKNLKILHIDCCVFPRPPLDLSGLKMLQHLTICDCNNLVAIGGVENMEFLEGITVLRCPSLREISDLSKFERLGVSSDDLRLFEGVKEIINEYCSPSFDSPSEFHHESFF